MSNIKGETIINPSFWEGTLNTQEQEWVEAMKCLLLKGISTWIFYSPSDFCPLACFQFSASPSSVPEKASHCSIKLLSNGSPDKM